MAMKILNLKRILAVDPGVTGTGWATMIWSERHANFNLEETGTITAIHVEADWQTRMHEVVGGFRGLLQVTHIEEVVMESPFFHGGVAGMVVATTGDLVKLSALFGALVEVVKLEGIPLRLPTPSQWKGQLTKAVTRLRCEQILGKKFGRGTSHSRDAVGIALWAIGKF